MALYVGDTRYKVMVGSQKHDFVVPLPYDAEVKWLQSDGNAYIDTGIKVAGNLSANVYLVDFFTSEFVGRSAFGGLDHIAEGDWDSDTRQFGFGINQDGKAVFYYDGSSIVFDDYSTYPQSARVVIENGVISVDSEQYTYTPASFTTLMSIILFGWHTGPIFITPCKIGPCYLSDGTTTLDLIPVRKDGVGYMYDKISGRLFGREETGNFIIGPDKVLPYDAEVEYLESNGAQYIDTGIDLDDGTQSIKLIFEAYLNKANEGGNSLIIAASIPNSGVQVYTYGNNSIYNQGATKTFQLQRRYTFTTITTNTSRSIQINSDAAAVQTFSRRIDDGARLYLLATPNSALNGRGTAGKYYSFKVLRNDVLCLDLVPVRVGQVGYMYDKVSGTLFGNAGSGNFIIGNDVTT